MISKSRLEKLERKHIVSSAVVIVRKDETMTEAEKRYEKKNRIKLAKCRQVKYIYDNI